MPDTTQTNAVGDTELLSTFIEKNKIKDITWTTFTPGLKGSGTATAHLYTPDVMAYPTYCMVWSAHQCVPSYKYEPYYIWTAYPEENSNLSM